LAQTHDASLADALEERLEGEILDRVERLSMAGDTRRQRGGGGGGGGGAGARRRHFVCRPSGGTDQRDKRHGAEVLLGPRILTGAADTQQVLRARGLADRNHEPTADRHLLLEGCRDDRPARGDHDTVEWR